MGQLDGKIAIVTGAASGFGAGIARSYVNAGARVVLADINLNEAQAVASELGPNASAVACDVTNGAQVHAAVAYCVDRFGTPDVVVNNAGIIHRNQPMLDVDEATFDRIMNVNVKSIYLMAQAVLPLMRQRRQGVMINVGSVGGIRPRPGLTWYCGSKGAVNLLSKAMAVELAPDNIRVNVICPVMGTTAMLEDAMGGNTPEKREKYIAAIPLGRFCDPADVANAAVFLASDASEFLTGVEMPVDGGRSI